MTAVSITTVHPEVVKERLRVISHLVTTEPEKYLKNRWELKRMAIMETLNLTTDTQPKRSTVRPRPSVTLRSCGCTGMD